MDVVNLSQVQPAVPVSPSSDVPKNLQVTKEDRASSVSDKPQALDTRRWAQYPTQLFSWQSLTVYTGVPLHLMSYGSLGRQIALQSFPSAHTAPRSIGSALALSSTPPWRMSNIIVPSWTIHEFSNAEEYLGESDMDLSD